jgi:hypothetical protein
MIIKTSYELTLTEAEKAFLRTFIDERIRINADWTEYTILTKMFTEDSWTFAELQQLEKILESYESQYIQIKMMLHQLYKITEMTPK